MNDKKKRRHSSSEDSSSSSSSSSSNSSDSDSTSGSSSSDDSRVKKKEKSEKSAPKTPEGRPKSAERSSIIYDKIDSEDFSPLKKVSKFENPTSSGRPRQSANIRRRSSSHEKSPGRKSEKGSSRVSVSESIKEILSHERKKELPGGGGVRRSPPRKSRSRSGSRQRATFARQGNSQDIRRNDKLWSSRIRKSSRSRSREYPPRRKSSRSPRRRHSRSITPRKSRSRSRGRNIRRRSSTRSRSSSREARQRRQQQRTNWNQGRRPPLRPPFRFRSRSPRPRQNNNYSRRSRSRSQGRTGGGRGQTPRKTSPSKDQKSLRRKSRSQSNPPRRLPLVNSSEVKSPRRPSGALTSDNTKKAISGTSDSESSSSSSSRSQTPVKKKKEKKRKAKEKKKKKKLLKKAKKLAKKKRKVKSKSAKAEKSPVAVVPIGPSPPKKPKTGPDKALIQQAKKYAPKSQAEWEKEQSVVRKVLDEETGRVRLVKGSGEIIESIVSRQQHKDINKSATRQDGESFQQHLKSQLK